MMTDRYMPDYAYTEVHDLEIPAKRADVYDTARHLDFSQSAVTRGLFKLRRLHANSLAIDDLLSGDGFTLLDELPPEEFVIGLAGTGIATPAPIQSGEHFTSLVLPRGIKIAWNFRTEVAAPELTRLRTETRVACYGRAAKLVFAAYWAVVRPFSGLIRKEMLRQVRDQARSG